QLAMQLQIRGHSPVKETARKRQQVQLTGKVGALHGGRERRERAKRQEMRDATQRMTRFPEQRRGPLRQPPSPPEGERQIVAPRQNAKARFTQIAELVERNLVGLVKKPAEEAEGIFGRQLAPRRGEKRLPERPRGPLLAAAEQRPAHAAFVVLSARQRQRQKRDVALVLELSRGGRQILGPERIVLELAMGDAVRRIAVAQVNQRPQHLPAKLLQPRPQLEPLFKLVDAPAERIVVGEQGGVDRAIGLAAEQRRRHELRVRRDGITAIAAKARGGFAKTFPAGGGHGWCNYSDWPATPDTMMPSIIWLSQIQ